MDCYNCGILIDETNVSEEHIINNSIGGRLKSKGLLCKKCNEGFGGTIDRELEEQIGMLTDLLGVKRERPKSRVYIPMYADDGEMKVVGVKMKPHGRLTVHVDENIEVNLYESDEKFDKLKDKKQKELEKKHNAKFEYIESTELPNKKKFRFKNKLTDEHWNIAFGGKDFFRAIAKISLNYYIRRGYEKAFCSKVIAFVKGEINNDLAYFYFPSPVHYQVHDLGNDEVSHIIHIRGDQNSRILYAYVELFNCQNVLIIYDMNYTGPAINDTYAFDLMTGKEIIKEVTIKLGRHHFEILDLIAMDAGKEHVAKFNRLERIIEKRQLT
jgi:hypothetical protein